IRELRKIVMLFESIEMRSQISFQRLIVRGLFQRVGVFMVGEKFNAFRFEHRSFGRQRSGLLVLLRQFSRGNFARLDVRLIERIYAYDRSSNSRGNFPTEKFLPQTVNVADRNSDDWLA